MSIPLNKNQFRVGLTGGIASGKSAAAKIFSTLGADIIDADAIAKSLTKKDHPNLQIIADQFGNQYIKPNGELDRKALRQLISHDSAANSWLKNLLHPQIFDLMMQQSEQSQAPYCILVIPLLAESSYDYHLDSICVIDCPEVIQLERLQKRDQLTSIEALNFAQLQTSRAKRLAIANDIISNHLDLDHLEQQIKQLHPIYLSHANEHKGSN